MLKLTIHFYSNAHLSGRAKPSITHSPRHTEIEKGNRITLDCGASGFPYPSFSWYKDGGRLSNAHSRYKILDNGTLVITNAQLSKYIANFKYYNMILPYGPEGGIKNTIWSPRAEGEARWLRYGTCYDSTMTMLSIPHATVVKFIVFTEKSLNWRFVFAESLFLRFLVIE